MAKTWVMSGGVSSLLSDGEDIVVFEMMKNCLCGLRKFYLGPTVGAKRSYKILLITSRKKILKMSHKILWFIAIGI